MIYILSGNIRTGKTTALFEWSKNREDVDGILCPDDEFGKRYFLKLKSHETFTLEVDENFNDDIISVGNFKFLKSSFKMANDYLISSGNEIKSKYFIIDELGKLELKSEGLHEAAKNLIPIFQSDKSLHLILIIRESLLNAILSHYNILKYKIIYRDDLDELN